MPSLRRAARSQYFLGVLGSPDLEDAANLLENEGERVWRL